MWDSYLSDKIHDAGTVHVLFVQCFNSFVVLLDFVAAADHI